MEKNNAKRKRPREYVGRIPTIVAAIDAIRVADLRPDHHNMGNLLDVMKDELKWKNAYDDIRHRMYMHEGITRSHFIKPGLLYLGLLPDEQALTLPITPDPRATESTDDQVQQRREISGERRRSTKPPRKRR